MIDGLSSVIVELVGIDQEVPAEEAGLEKKERGPEKVAEVRAMSDADIAVKLNTFLSSLSGVPVGEVRNE